jgi:hypothetical protein
MTLRLAVRELHRAERSLGRALRAAADRHRVEHEIYFVARDLARWSDEHVRALADAGRSHGLRLHGPASTVDVLGPVQRRVSEALGRRAAPGLLLLADLRRLHRKTAGVSLDWELLAQGAQAKQDTALLELATHCHPETLRQLAWTNAMLKTLSPQVVVN